jgi:hypothetical protein
MIPKTATYYLLPPIVPNDLTSGRLPGDRRNNSLVRLGYRRPKLLFDQTTVVKAEVDRVAFKPIAIVSVGMASSASAPITSQKQR